jgi:hypothetical protein
VPSDNYIFKNDQFFLLTAFKSSLVELALVGLYWSTADKLKPGGVSGNNYTSVDQVHTTGVGSLITCASKKQSKNV